MFRAAYFLYFQFLILFSVIALQSPAYAGKEGEPSHKKVRVLESGAVEASAGAGSGSGPRTEIEAEVVESSDRDRFEEDLSSGILSPLIDWTHAVKFDESGRLVDIVFPTGYEFLTRADGVVAAASSAVEGAGGGSSAGAGGPSGSNIKKRLRASELNVGEGPGDCTEECGEDGAGDGGDDGDVRDHSGYGGSSTAGVRSCRDLFLRAMPEGPILVRNLVYLIRKYHLSLFSEASRIAASLEKAHPYVLQLQNRKGKVIVDGFSRAQLQSQWNYLFRENYEIENTAVLGKVQTRSRADLQSVSALFNAPARLAAKAGKVGTLFQFFNAIEVWNHTTSTSDYLVSLIGKTRYPKKIPLTLDAIRSAVDQRVAPRNFPIHVVNDVIEILRANHLLTQENNAIDLLDPCAGWGDRLVAAMLSPAIKSYTGIDPNPACHPGYQQAIEHYSSKYPESNKPVRMIRGVAEELHTMGLPQFDLTLTSPPYFDCEQYCEEEDQSFKKYLPKGSKDSIFTGPGRLAYLQSWLDGFLFKMMENVSHQTKSGGIIAINIADTNSRLRRTTKHHRNEICLPMIEYAQTKLDLEYVGVIVMAQPGMSGIREGAGRGSSNDEPIWIFRKKG